jgi:tetratricopeptide (TPR) repeat protein
LTSLRHQIPKEAVSAFKSAEKAAGDNDINLSIEYLHKAITIDPQFVEALHNLAAHYSALRRDEEALSYARMAFQIDPDLQDTGYTLSSLLTDAKRYEEAATITRRILTKRPYLSEARALLAVSLVHLGEINEAYRQLRVAAADFSMARLLAANSLVEIGRRDLAEIQINEYLRSAPPDCEQKSLAAWLERSHTLQPRKTLSSAIAQ